MGVDQAGQDYYFAKINHRTAQRSYLFKAAHRRNPIARDRNRAIVDRRTIHRDDGSGAVRHPERSRGTSGRKIQAHATESLGSARDDSFTTLRASATSRLHASWQSSGMTFSPRPVWSSGAMNLSSGSRSEGRALVSSRAQRIVRKHPGAPPCDRQKRPTNPSTSSSEIFAAARYIPDWRPSVSRNGVVVKPVRFPSRQRG